MLKRQKLFPLILVFLTLGGCAQLLERRSFIDEMDRDDGLFVAGRDFPTVPGDSARYERSREDLMSRTPASYRSKEEFETQRSLRRELQRQESELSEHERMGYSQAKSILKTDSERIYYLNLNRRDRRDYLQSKMSDANPYDFQDNRRGLSLLEERQIDAPRLREGMGKQAVRRMMGEPMRVDVAGNPRHENERWAFTQNGEVQYVYFEGGRVHGWVFD